MGKVDRKRRIRLTASQKLIVVYCTFAAFCVWSLPFGCSVLWESELDAMGAACRSNLKQFTYGLLLYAEDHDDRLPRSASWFDLASFDPLRAQAKKNLRCYAWHGAGTGYAMNAKLSGRSLSSVADAAGQVLLFEADIPGWNAAADPAKTPHPYRHGRRYIYWIRDPADYAAFADGHVAEVRQRGNGK